MGSATMFLHNICMSIFPGLKILLNTVLRILVEKNNNEMVKNLLYKWLRTVICLVREPKRFPLTHP